MQVTEIRGSAPWPHMTFMLHAFTKCLTLLRPAQPTLMEGTGSTLCRIRPPLQKIELVAMWLQRVDAEPCPILSDVQYVDLYEENGGPGAIRTRDLCLRRATLYPAELRVRGARSSGIDRGEQQPQGADRSHGRLYGNQVRQKHHFVRMAKLPALRRDA